MSFKGTLEMVHMRLFNGEGRKEDLKGKDILSRHFQIPLGDIIYDEKTGLYQTTIISDLLEVIIENGRVEIHRYGLNPNPESYGISHPVYPVSYTLNDKMKRLIRAGVVHIKVYEEDGNTPPKPWVEIQTDLEKTVIDHVEYVGSFELLKDAIHCAKAIGEIHNFPVVNP